MSVCDNPAICLSVVRTSSATSAAVAIAAGIVVLMTGGCSGIGESPLSVAAPQAADVVLIDSLAHARSIEDIDARMDALLAQSSEANAEALLHGWGRHGSWYDLAVVRFLTERWPSDRVGDDGLDPRRLARIVLNRLDESPELRGQVAWYTQWKHGPVDFSDLCHRLENGLFVIHGRVRACDEIPALLFVAGLSDDKAAFQSVDADDASALHLAKRRFLADRPYWAYDDVRGCYAIDAAAKHAGKHLDPVDQQATPRSTPLPAWDCDVFPERPLTSGGG